MHTNADHAWAVRLRSALASRRPIDPQQEDEALGRLLGIAACERCGHTILLGEGRHRTTLHGLSLLVCRDCERQLSTHKAARAA
jgi:ribosome-binding protein aMBF1 (putative translation factor)